MNIDNINRLRGFANDALRMRWSSVNRISPSEAIALLDAAEQQISQFQQRVQPWMLACFGPMIAGDRKERNHRFLEESLELVQSTGCTASEAHQLVDYVYGRPVGEPAQEVGGVMVTLAALCLANELDMHECGETELARIWTKVEAIRAKQAAKPKHSPLPESIAALSVTVDTPEFEVLANKWYSSHFVNAAERDGAWNRVVAHIDAHTAAVTAKAVAAKQAEIDSLMLEYCPNEMSAAQMATWAAHQRRAPGPTAPQQHAQAAQPFISPGMQLAADFGLDVRVEGKKVEPRQPAQPIAGELPPLPPCPMPNEFTGWWPLKLEEAMQAYGHQCRAAALEDAAKLIEPRNPAYAAAIRALNKGGA